MPRRPRPWNEIAPTLTSAAIRRFWTKVRQGGLGECWPWQAGRFSEGYGQFNVGRLPPQGAHRIAFGLANGGIPDESNVMHTCDNPACCNPAHLRSGSHLQNMADRKAKGRNRNGITVSRMGKAASRVND
jgi:hypothetical protein